MRGMGDLSTDLRRLLTWRLEKAGLDDPFLPSLLRWRARTDGVEAVAGSPKALGMLHRWTTVGVGGPDTPLRYPWEIPVARFLPKEAIAGFRPWDSELKARDPERWAQGFWLPAVLGDALEWLASQRAPDAKVDAERLLGMVRRRVDADLARRVAELEPWSGTFALNVLATRPRTLERLHPIATALLMRLAADAEEDGGRVLGQRFPLHGTPLVGPTAQLGRALVALGQGLDLLGGMVAFLREAQRPDGGWGEPGWPTDLLTTLAAASFLAAIDPGFDPRSAFTALEAAPEAARDWAAIDRRDGSFVAAEVLAYVDAASLPFEARFRWPHVPSWLLDPHCGLPRFGAFQAIADLAAAVPDLARASFEIAFIDLADFGRWNTEWGMELGDDVLRFFGDFLREVPDARVIQDGGDEMLVVGAPCRTSLLGDLALHLEGTATQPSWTARFRARFGDRRAVLPRGIVAISPGSDLIRARGRLGEAIGRVKCWYPEPGANGTILSDRRAAELPDCPPRHG